MSCSISTFGFGYDMDSGLLKNLATEGQGMYAFIPDGSFVGTAFVNATSNILATCARQVCLKVSGLDSERSRFNRLFGSGSRGASTSSSSEEANKPRVLGFPDALEASWGLQVDFGGVAYGQTRDVVVELPAGADLSKVRVDVSSPPGPSWLK